MLEFELYPKIPQEYLEAMATVGRETSLPMLVVVNPDSNRVGDEYFKVFDSDNFFSAKKVARILFREAKYISHRDTKERWVLNSKEKKVLVKFLQSKSTKLGLRNYTNWQVAILQFNEEKGLDQNKTLENVRKRLKYPKYLPFDLEMPDYLLL